MPRFVILDKTVTLDAIYLSQYKLKFYAILTYIDNQIDGIVHCEWNDWIIGDCSVSCGGGNRTNIRTENVTAQHGGDECEGTKTIEESCNVQECPGYRFYYSLTTMIK